MSGMSYKDKELFSEMKAALYAFADWLEECGYEDALHSPKIEDGEWEIFV